MGGSIDVDVPGPVLTEPAILVTVDRYDGAGNYDALPNVLCEQIEFQIGPHPSTARFRYVLDHTVRSDYADWPSQFEQVWPVTAQGRFVVQPDDRLVVSGWTPEGRRIVLFDGFPQMPQADLSPGSQRVGFQAAGVESRCWDAQIGGRVQRDADDPNAGKEIQTDLPTRFNPSDGRGGVLPNCTPKDHDVKQSDDMVRYPVFLEAHLERSPDPRRAWNVADAICYLLAVWNDEKFVKNPDFFDVRDKVAVRAAGDKPFDPKDPAQFTRDELPTRDLDVTGKAWPDVMEQLLAACGLGFYFSLEQDDSGNPATRVRIERKDTSPRATKSIRLDRFRRAIDPAASNVDSLSLVRDVNGVVNAFTVETPPRRVECSIVLACGFSPASGDESGTARNAFLNSRLADATAAVKRKYRYYVADECGDGHWDGSWITGVGCNLSAVLPPDDDGSRSYVRRYRPGQNQLLSLDDLKRPRKCLLHYSQDYSGPVAATWDGSGTWTEIGGGWKLLHDRLGIEVTINDPEAWHVGEGKAKIAGITWQANPPAGKQFYLLLTTVIEDDLQLGAAVPARVSSPTKYTRRRTIDARDHYQKQTLAKQSWFNKTDAEVVIRDDTDKAKDLARQYRAAHEMPPLSGSVTLPYITTQYNVFDRIRAVKGREATLRANVGADQGEGPRYPYVVKVSWQFAGDKQATTLQLTDLRGEPPRA